MTIPTGDIAPLFLVYGNSAFEAQHLERGLALLLHLIGECEKKRFPKRAIESLSTSEAHKTLGRPFAAAKPRTLPNVFDRA